MHVGLGHERAQVIRWAVCPVRCKEGHPLVCPAAVSSERSHGHNFDRVDAQLAQIVEPSDGRLPRPFWGEGPGMQLVDRPPFESAWRCGDGRGSAVRAASTPMNSEK